MKARSLEWVLNPGTGVLARRGEVGHRDAQREDSLKSPREEGHEMTEAETGVMQLRSARDDWKLPEARKRQGTVLPWSLIREHGPADTLILDFSTPRSIRINCCCFRPPRFWQFVTALASQYS